MTLRIKLAILLPVTGALLTLTACSGTDTASGPAADAAAQAPAAAAPADASGTQTEAAEADADQDAKEEPLTGDIAEKAKQAALAAYPGTVLKAEHDAEKPGMYAVEIEQADGKTVEVYLTKDFKVSGTKDEGTEGDGDDN